jgi:uncharacterized protein (UPF0332 family)
MLKEDYLSWCFKQKNGIRIVEPNDDMAKAYLKKAISALNTMTAALKIRETDWIAATAYYARYFALYSLLMKFGIKSEIHDCTIRLGRYLSENGVLSKTLIDDIEQAKQTRVDMQYYVVKEFSLAEVMENVEAARKFVLAAEKQTLAIKANQIQTIRQQLKSMVNGY